jgi:hypothetical protein
MKKIVVLLIVMVTVVGLANMVRAEDWYVIEVWEGRCAKLSEGGTWKTPADCIKAYQTLQTPYKVIDDKVDNGKVVQVTVIDLGDYTSMTFYYGVDRCKEALKAKKTKQEKELEKYK